MAVNVGIIGCGQIAGAHLQGYQNNGIPVAALADVNPEALKKLGERAPGAVRFTGYRELVDSGRVQAVSVCSPPCFHEEAVGYALSRGIHVLCEKPLAHDLPGARAILAAADKSKALLMTAFRHRFLPAVKKMKELVEQDVIGQPVLFHNNFCGPAFDMDTKWFSKKKIAGGGSLMDTSSHSVDLFRYLVGEVATQQAATHRYLEKTDVEDTSVLLLKSPGGTLGSLAASWVAGSGAAYIDIIGQKGRLLYDYFKPDQAQLIKRQDKQWQALPVASSMGFAEEIGHFVSAIKGETQLTCTGYDGLRAVEIIQACYE